MSLNLNKMEIEKEQQSQIISNCQPYNEIIISKSLLVNQNDIKQGLFKVQNVLNVSNIANNPADPVLESNLSLSKPVKEKKVKKKSAKEKVTEDAVENMVKTEVLEKKSRKSTNKPRKKNIKEEIKDEIVIVNTTNYNEANVNSTNQEDNKDSGNANNENNENNAIPENQDNNEISQIKKKPKTNKIESYSKIMSNLNNICNNYLNILNENNNNNNNHNNTENIIIEEQSPTTSSNINEILNKNEEEILKFLKTFNKEIAKKEQLFKLFEAFIILNPIKDKLSQLKSNFTIEENSENNFIIQEVISPITKVSSIIANYYKSHPVEEVPVLPVIENKILTTIEVQDNNKMILENDNIKENKEEIIQDPVDLEKKEEKKQKNNRKRPKPIKSNGKTNTEEVTEKPTEISDIKDKDKDNKKKEKTQINNKRIDSFFVNNNNFNKLNVNTEAYTCNIEEQTLERLEEIEKEISSHIDNLSFPDLDEYYIFNLKSYINLSRGKVLRLNEVRFRKHYLINLKSERKTAYINSLSTNTVNNVTTVNNNNENNNKNENQNQFIRFIYFENSSYNDFRNKIVKSSSIISFKNPFKMDEIILDYDMESEEEHNEFFAEDISSEKGEKNEDEEEELEEEEDDDNKNELIKDKFVVDDGYLSADEKGEDEVENNVLNMKESNINKILEVRMNYNKPIVIELNNAFDNKSEQIKSIFVAKVLVFKDYLLAHNNKLLDTYFDDPVMNDYNNEFPVECEIEKKPKINKSNLAQVQQNNEIEDYLQCIVRLIHYSFENSADIIKERICNDYKIKRKDIDLFFKDKVSKAKCPKTHQVSININI